MKASLRGGFFLYFSHAKDFNCSFFMRFGLGRIAN